MADTIKENVSSSLFLSIPVPDQVTPIIIRSFENFPPYIKNTVPQKKWHLTLLWLGETENPKQYYSRLMKPLPQTFVPTVQLTHVGRGLQRSQLWAYADNSALLNNIRSQLLPRLAALRFPIPEKTKNDNFVPHIHVANLFNMAGGIGLADYPIPASFMIREIQIIRSEKSSGGTVHHVAGTIPLLQ